MIRPDYEIISILAKEYDMIPIKKEIHADVITPIMILRKISAISRNYFLLESVEAGTQWGRYSFLGHDPVMRIYGREQRIIIENEGRTEEVFTDKPYDILRRIQQRYRAPEIPGMPPFTGGFVGYFSYAMLSLAEQSLKIKCGEFNDFELMLFDKVIVYDHLKQKISVVVNMLTENGTENYDKAINDIDRIIGLITDTRKLPSAKSDKNVDFKCNVSKEEYCRLVEKPKNISGRAIYSRQLSHDSSQPHIKAVL